MALNRSKEGEGASGDGRIRKGFSVLRVLRLRDFRLLWLGQGISVLGDQFYLIALPWLVLQMRGSAFSVGSVLALAGIPRALFMLLGGAVTDRFSPRLIMLLSNLIRMLCVALLAALVISGDIRMWMVYMFALSFGLADGFFFPAQHAIIPHIVEPDDLQAGNALVEGTSQVSVFAGPALAGVLIALLSGGRAVAGAELSPDLRSLGVAFVVDAATFLVSILSLLLMHVGRRTGTENQASAPPPKVFASILEGLRYVWKDVTLRTVFLVIAAVQLFVVGPVLVGIPVLAKTRLPEGVAAFGLVMSALGGGSLFGVILAGLLPKPRRSWMGMIILTAVVAAGMGLASLGFARSTFAVSVTVLMMGTASGYVTILLMTWLQRRSPGQMLGRMMGLLNFAYFGLIPVSQVVSGFLIQRSLTWVFRGAGVMMAVLALWAATIPALRGIGVEVGMPEPASTEGGNPQTSRRRPRPRGD